MTKRIVYLKKSTRPGKKWMVYVDPPGKTIHFGAKGMSDYTKHKDKNRMKRYSSRHKSTENWSRGGITTAGFWSKHLLWGKPTIGGSKRAIASKYNVTFRSGWSTHKSNRKSRKRRKSSRPSKRRRKSSRPSKRRRKSSRPSKRRRKSTVRFRFSSTKEWIVYTHPTNDGCPSCVGAKEYLKEKGIIFKAIRGKEDGWPNPSYKTWPKIYSPDGKFIGGFSDLKKKTFR